MFVGQLMFDGLAMGLVFVLLATGLVLIASVNRILFMAYGMFYTIGAYATWWVMHILNFPYFASLLLAVIFSAFLGMLCQLLLFNPLMKKEGGFLATLIASMGLMSILAQGDLLTFGTVARSIPAVFPGVLHVASINMPIAKVALIIIGVGATILLFLVYERTGFGRAMRTVSFLPEVASLQGINVNRIYILTLGLGTAIAGIAGGILAPTYGINPSMGNNILWTVLLMSMLGGMDSLLGAVVGGLVIGQLLSFGQFFIGSAVQIVIFVVIGIVLYFKPNGLLGRGIDIGV